MFTTKYMKTQPKSAKPAKRRVKKYEDGGQVESDTEAARATAQAYNDAISNSEQRRDYSAAKSAASRYNDAMNN